MDRMAYNLRGQGIAFSGLGVAVLCGPKIDRLQKPAEAGTLVVACPGDAEILIDDARFLKPQLPGAVLQRILTPAAF